VLLSMIQLVIGELEQIAHFWVVIFPRDSRSKYRKALPE